MMTMILMAIYLVAMIIMGLYLRTKVSDTRDYYVAGRSLPWYLIMMTMAATYIGAGATLADTGLAYDDGLAAAIPCLIGMGGMLLFGILSPKVSKIGFKYDIISVSGLLAYRFGKPLGFLSAFVVAWALIGTLAGQVSGSGTVIPIMFNNIGVTVSYEFAIVVMVCIMIFYVFLGGMFSVAWTDFVQCIILVIGMSIILPLLMVPEAGGFGNIFDSSNYELEGFLNFKPGMYVIGLTFTYILYFLAGPPYWQRSFSSKDPQTSRWGTILGICVIVFYTCMIILLGVTARNLMPTTDMESQAVVVTLMTQLMHPLISAIVTCAIMAAIMSTMSSYLLTSVQAIITDMIKPYKAMTEKHELILAKVLVVVVGIAALIFALKVQAILDALLLAMGFYSACMAAPVFCAVFWKKTTKAGAYASFFGGIFVYFLWNFVLGVPWEMNATIPGGITSIILIFTVSLATYKSNPAPHFEGVERDDAVVDKRELEELEEKEA